MLYNAQGTHADNNDINGLQDRPINTQH